MNLLAMWKIRYNWRLRRNQLAVGKVRLITVWTRAVAKKDGKGKIFRKYLHLVWHNVKSVQEMSYWKMDYVIKHLWKGYAADRAGVAEKDCCGRTCEHPKSWAKLLFLLLRGVNKNRKNWVWGHETEGGVWWGSKWKNPEVRLFSGSCSSGGLCGVQALGAPKLRVLGEGRKLNQSVVSIICSYSSVRTKQFS